jgi:hypothetical protein
MQCTAGAERPRGRTDRGVLNSADHGSGTPTRPELCCKIHKSREDQMRSALLEARLLPPRTEE